MTAIQFTFVEGPTTPERYRAQVGRKTPVFDPAPQYVPAPGTAGTLMGIPGYFRDGDRFEIAEVDMRSDVEKLLDEAAEILTKPPLAGEIPGVVQKRQLEAQHLLLKAQLAILRRQA